MAISFSLPAVAPNTFTSLALMLAQHEAALLKAIAPTPTIPPPGLFNVFEDLIKAHAGLPAGFDEVMQGVNARLSGQGVVASPPATPVCADGAGGLGVHALPSTPEPLDISSITFIGAPLPTLSALASLF